MTQEQATKLAYKVETNLKGLNATVSIGKNHYHDPKIQVKTEPDTFIDMTDISNLIKLAGKNSYGFEVSKKKELVFVIY